MEEDRRISSAATVLFKEVRRASGLGRERGTGMTSSSVVLMKGTSGQFATVIVLDFIMERDVGKAVIVLKIGGSAIDTLTADVVETEREGSHHHDGEESGSAAVVVMEWLREECRESTDLIRTLLSACEGSLGTGIKLEGKIVILRG